MGWLLKAGLGATLLAAGIGLSVFMFNKATSEMPAGSTNKLERNLNQTPGNAINGLDQANDAIQGNPTAKAAANQSPTYRAASQTPGWIDNLKSWLAIAWIILKWTLRVLFVVGCIALVTRTLDRRKREYRIYELRGHREELVSTEQIRSLMSSWFNLMFVRRRRMTRIFLGSPSMSLRMLSIPDTRKDRNQLAVYIQVPANVGLEEIFDHGFNDAYQDAQLIEVKNYPMVGENIVRLKKTRIIPNALRVAGTSKAADSIMEGFNSPIVDRVASTMASRRKPCEIQYVMTSAPRPFDRLIYWLSRGKYSGALNNDPIQNMEGQNTAESTATEAHVFCEIRIGSPDYRFARDTAAAFSGAAGGDAQLRERRPVWRRKLYQGRFHKGIGNPIPGWLTSVMSSSEMASIWALPSTSLRSISIKRSNKRRIETPPEVWYPKNPKFGMFKDMRGKQIALHEDDFNLGTRVLGLQGMGKSVLMTSMVSSVAAQNPNKAIIVLDPNKDLADGVMRSIAPNRVVRYIDFKDPLCGIDPFLNPDKDLESIASVLLQGLIDVAKTDAGETQILASSEDFIDNASMATLATTLDFNFRPTMFHLQRWVEISDGAIAYQADLNAAVIGRRPDLHNTYNGIQNFHAQIQKSESQFTARAGAPYNKFRLLSKPAIDRILRHPKSVDIEKVIEDGEVLVVSGHNHGEVQTIFRFVMQMVHQALGRLEVKYENTPKKDRPSLLFVLDEAGELLTRTTVKMIAQRRSAGLAFVAGLQHDHQITDPLVREGIGHLLQNVFQFRTGETDARTRINQFQVSYDDQYDSRLRQVRDMRISPAGIMNLPRYHFYTSTTAHGDRIAAYGGETIDSVLNDDWYDAHVEQMIRDGGGRIGRLAGPKLDEEKRAVMNQMLKKPPSGPEVTDPDTFVGGFEAAADAGGDRDTEGGVGVEDVRTTSSPVHPAFQTDLTPEDLAPPSGGNGDSGSNGNGHSNGNGGSNGDNSNGHDGDAAEPGQERAAGSDESALDREIDFQSSDALDDLSVVSNEAAGFDERGETKKKRTKLAPVGPLGQHLGKEMTLLLENVDELRSLPPGTAVRYEEPAKTPAGSIQARNARAENLANDSTIFPQDWCHVLGLLYELNYLSNQQIAILTGRAQNTVTTRMRRWMNDAGAVRGVTLAGRKFWTLTDMGARIGRQMQTRNGPMVPLEPGKGDNGRYEAKRVWKPRNLNDAQAVVHDLHLAAWVMQWILLCDGDFRVVMSREPGIVQRVRGEFSSMLTPPKIKKGRQWRDLDVRSLIASTEGIGFDGLDFEQKQFGSLSPDAVISMHNLAPHKPDPAVGKRDIWIELDRQGHHGQLRDKFRRLDEFLGAWWQLVPRFEKAKRQPTIIFVAPTEEILKRQLAIADEVLCVRSGPVRASSEQWEEPISRKRIFFALEADLHKGSTRVYQVPEKRPSVRLEEASTQRERQEAAVCNPVIIDEFLPARLLAGRREGTNLPGPH